MLFTTATKDNFPGLSSLVVVAILLFGKKGFEMAIARWADVSSHQNKVINSLYKLPWFFFRACDGEYRDPLFHDNDKFVRTFKQLFGYGVYSVWPRSLGWSTWQETFAILKDMLGNDYRPRMILMQDVESWNRNDLRKDFSADLEAERKAMVAWLNSLRPSWHRSKLFRAYFLDRDERRVIGYGNRGDLQTMAGGATKVRWRSIILADYRTNVDTPDTFLGWAVLGRQHTNGVIGDLPHGTEPFGNCDMNRAKVGPRRLAKLWGLGTLRWTLK